ncbi:Lrp/AsnC family transcriptional regulator, partial [Paenibacillus chitinolyticus]
MDQVDKQILLQLQEHGRISMTELGKAVGLSQPAVTERVRRLEEKGVIQEYRACLLYT